MPATDVRLLGPIEVTLDGRPIELGATKQRAVLTILALRANAVVSVDELVESLWGEEPPASATKLIQHYISQLRKLLAGGDAEIVTRSRGYQLRARPEAVDAVDFERLVDAAARGDGNGTAARQALSLWRGTPLLEVIDEPFAAAELRRLEDLWLNVSEHAIGADIEAGRNDEVIAQLDELVQRHPLRERLHALRMRALYAAGRQAEALEAFRQARSILVEEVGVEPGPELQRLHEAMLRQDPGLAAPGRPPARPRSRRQLPRALVLAAGVAVLAGGVVFAVSRITEPDSLDGIDENAVGQIDTADTNLVGQYVVGREPRALVVGDGSVWVADTKDETVSRLEPSRDRVVTIPVGSEPVALAFGDRALWVAERGDGTVAEISPASSKVTRRIESVNAPSALAAGNGAVWIGSAVDRTVTRVRADGSDVVIHLGAPPSALAIGAGAVWIASEETGTLFRVEPRTGTVVRAIRVGNRPVAVAAGTSGVWVVNRQDATVWRIDPATNSVSDTIPVARDPAAITLSASDAWVATADGQVSRINRQTRRVSDTVELGNPATALAADGESVWLATRPAAARHRGGTVTVGEGPFDSPYLDPAADVQQQPILSLAYDGLIAYRRTGGTTFGPLVGDLAADVPEPSPDGRTYVFTLRRGIRFSDGAALKPEDFRASLEDRLRRHGELATFFDPIIGASHCIREPRACDLSSGIITDARERTITLRLRRPDPYLLYKLASPLAYIARAEHPFRKNREPPGTGPYRVDDFDHKHRVELTRNPYFRLWSQDARPDGLVDRILVRVSENPRAQVAAVQRGDLDVVALADAFGTSVPSREVQALFARYPERLHTSATPSLLYLWMNVHEPPFDDVRVRRALNYAVDRGLVAELEGGAPLVLPACHHVAPGHPGYVPECDYTRDPDRGGIWSGPDTERTHSLIERSHTAGQQVTVSVPSEEHQVGHYIARLLERLGYRSRLRDFGDEYADFHGYVADSRNGAQVGTDTWAADFPTPTDFTTPFRCDSFIPRSPASSNLPEYCDEGFERRIEAALRARGAETDARWHRAYRYLARAAPAAPLVNRRGAVFVSERLGNYQHHPLLGVLLDQVWVRR